MYTIHTHLFGFFLHWSSGSGLWFPFTSLYDPLFTLLWLNSVLSSPEGLSPLPGIPLYDVPLEDPNGLVTVENSLIIILLSHLGLVLSHSLNHPLPLSKSFIHFPFSLHSHWIRRNPPPSLKIFPPFNISFPFWDARTDFIWPKDNDT